MNLIVKFRELKITHVEDIGEALQLIEQRNPDVRINSVEYESCPFPDSISFKSLQKVSIK